MPDGKLFNAVIACDPILEKSDSIFENSKKINWQVKMYTHSTLEIF